MQENYHLPKQNRQSIRLKGYDYAQQGLYFITICTQNRACLFGEIINKEMILNDAGKTAVKCWIEIPEHFPNTKLHEYVIMPNHIHGIIEITNTAVGANEHSPDNSPEPDNRAKNISPLPAQSPSKTIGSVVRGFKIGVTKWFREFMPFQFPVGENVWQRNYWEHIIRNEPEYQRISQYIINNPQNWTNDKLKL